MGSSPASAECLRAILREEELDVVGIVTQPDRPVGRGKVLSPCPLAKFAEEHGLADIIKPERVNDPEPMERIRAWKPDVIAVVSFGQILKKPLLDLPLFGCINCHFSLLPKYRGAAPVVAALAAGERLTGVTVMHMGVGLDDGPIMLQSFEPIYPDTVGGDLMRDLAIAGGVALAKALRLLNANALPPEVKQDESAATYVKKLKKTDGLIDWDRPVLEIERRIRAYNPWPTCYTFLPEKLRRRGSSGRLAILRAKVAKMDPAWKDSPPGTIVGLGKQGPIVRCHDTVLQLVEVKPEGSSLMTGASFCCGRPVVAGETRFVMV